MSKKRLSVKSNYNENWKHIVENPDGSLNKLQVQKELADFSMLIDHLSKLYFLATGGRVSYVTTLPEEVYSEFQNQLETQYDRGYTDAKDDYKVDCDWE